METRAERRVEFVVHGKAATAGSKRAFALRRANGSLVKRPDGSPVINVTDDCTKSKEWKGIVAWAARQAVGAGFALLDGPLAVAMKFVQVRPKNQYRTGRNAHLLREGAPTHPTAKPDVLKLARAVEDALTGVLWLDDAQIVDERLMKVWGDSVRVEIVVSTITAVDVALRSEVA